MEEPSKGLTLTVERSIVQRPVQYTHTPDMVAPAKGLTLTGERPIVYCSGLNQTWWRLSKGLTLGVERGIV